MLAQLREDKPVDVRDYVILFITLVVATAFLYIWKRRDEGREPVDPRG